MNTFEHILTTHIAEQIHDYRQENDINGDTERDWYDAEYFLSLWRKEYIQSEDEFLRVWCGYNVKGGEV